MQLSTERPNSCPIDQYGEREYYFKTWHDARRRILETYRLMQQDEDKAAEKQRRDRRFYPIHSSDILKLIAENCFWVPPMPHHSKEQSIEWIEVILNRRIISIETTLKKHANS